MKKAGSIIISLLMLIAVMHLSVATHYCQGNIAASKISFSGKHASCGMESDTPELPLPGDNLKSNCCDDVVVTYSIDDNYSPSSFSIADTFQYITQIYSIPAESPLFSATVTKSIFLNVGPPYIETSTNVDLADICVFRI